MLQHDEFHIQPKPVLAFQYMKQKLSCLIAIAFVVNGCASARTKKFESALQGGRCEEALENIPEHDKNLKFAGSTQRAAGKVLSYAATGAGYTADVLLNVGTGVLIGTAICAPFIALALGSRADFSNADIGACYPKEAFNLVNTKMGESAYKNTEDWRCPDLTALSQSVRKVAKCHSSAGTNQGMKNALTTLSAIKSNRKFMNCITDREKETLLSEYSSYENAKALLSQ
jgi:hypothetical protein